MRETGELGGLMKVAELLRTENVIEIAGLGKACDVLARDFDKNTEHLKKMRDLLAELLQKSVPNVRFNGHPIHTLPNTLSASFLNVKATELMAKIQSQVSVSAGATHPL